MTQDEVSILKNAVLDATEAYVDVRLDTLDFVKTQIGIVQSYTESRNKYYHEVKCNNGKITYKNVLSVGNIPFPANSTVFLIAPNAQYSNQFILGKLDDTPCSIRGGSININNKFIVEPDGTMTAKSGTFEGEITGGSINIKDKFIVESDGTMVAKAGTFEGAITGGSIDINNNFIVDSNGNMQATTGKIGNFELREGSLYAKGIVYLAENKTVYASSKSLNTRSVVSFVPKNISSKLSILSSFKLTFRYNIITDYDRDATLKLQYKSGGKWYDVSNDSAYSLEDSEESKEITFKTTFYNTSSTSYRIVIVFSKTTSSTYRQSYNCSVYTNEVVKTTISTDGYVGKINSSDATISDIKIISSTIYNTDSSENDGFYISDNKFLLNDDGRDLLTYKTYGDSRNYNHAGLFIGSVDFATDVSITCGRTSNNYLQLRSDGQYTVVVSGETFQGYIYDGSDRRIKEDITPLETQFAKDLINSTDTYKFKYKNIEGYHYGVIAQEVREVLDSLGETDARLEYGCGDSPTIENQRNVIYQEYIPPMIIYMKDLQRQIDELRKEDK